MGLNVKEIDKNQYEELVLKSDKPVVLDFYSTECPPCEALAPKFTDLAGKFGEHMKFFKIFRQENRELADELGVSSSPTLLFFNNGKEAGNRLNGGIRKKAILSEIEGLVSPGDFNKLNKKEIRKREVDIIIMGGGPAGLTAAIYAAQAKLKTLLIDQELPGGQVKITHLIANYPGTEKPVSGMELAYKMEVQAKGAGAEIIGAVDVTKIDLTGDVKKVIIDDELEISAPALVLAMGSEPRLLGIPGEKEYRGSGISYCATCDGKFYDGREIIVVGGGNSAIEESLFLTRFASKITIIHQFDHLQANKTAQEKAFANPKINIIWDSEPRKFELTPEKKVSVSVENIKTGEYSDHLTDGVFIFVGMAPNTANIKGNLNTNEWGYIPANEDMETNIPGVYAVGDVRDKKIRQVATAVSDGCIAAVIAEKYIAAQK